MLLFSGTEFNRNGNLILDVTNMGDLTKLINNYFIFNIVTFHIMLPA